MQKVHRLLSIDRAFLILMVNDRMVLENLTIQHLMNVDSFRFFQILDVQKQILEEDQLNGTENDKLQEIQIDVTLSKKNRLSVLSFIGLNIQKTIILLISNIFEHQNLIPIKIQCMLDMIIKKVHLPILLMLSETHGVKKRCQGVCLLVTFEYRLTLRIS